MAVMPSVQGLGLSSVGDRVDRPIEVVGDREHLAEQVLAREPHLPLALLVGAAPEVLELGTRALQAVEMLGRFRAGRLELGREALDLGLLGRVGGWRPRALDARIVVESFRRAAGDALVACGIGHSGIAWEEPVDAGSGWTGRATVVGHAYRCSTSSFMRPETKPTVPIACG